MTGRAVALTLAAAAALLAGCGQETSPPGAAMTTPSAALAAQSAPQQLLLLAAAQGQRVTAVRWDTRGRTGTVTVTDTTTSTEAPRVIPVRSESPAASEPTDAILLVGRDGQRVGSLTLETDRSAASLTLSGTPGELRLRSLPEGEFAELLTRLRLRTSTSATARP